MAAAGPLTFSGRVAVITGAGGGLGREYALMLAARGAAVVVNDLGGSRSGEGKSSSAADAVVQEIKSKGGKAVPDYNSVEEGDKIVKTAIDNFGRIDILINNAGILRDKSFVKITEADWDLVHRVHLRGSFIVTKAAWPYFRKQNYGRVIMTASGAGIFGNFGQANYSSAKLGMLGLSNTLAIEGAKYGIHCNTIVPVAASRLTEDILPPELFDRLKPGFVCPVVVWLCHENCEDNGGVYEAAGGWVGKYQWQRSLGKVFIPPTNMTVEAVRDNWQTVTDMTDATTPANITDAMVSLSEALNGDNVAPTRKRQKVQAVDSDPGVYHYQQDAAILYALAVGMSTKEPNYLDFLYENSDNFMVLPSFGTIVGMPAVFSSPALQSEMEKLGADPTRILHGEQYLELYKPLPASSTLSSKSRVLDVLDKGSGAVAIIEVDTFNDAGEKVMYSQWSVFLVGSGKFGGKRNSDVAKPVVPVPKRQPDSVLQETISVDQAALYRLCGDKNPMHIDPSFAAIGGFSEPILHGLCSFGYATRHVLKQYANYDVKLFRSIMARFASPIVPGHTLRTEMWKEGNRIHFQSICAETGKVVISNAYIDLIGSTGPQQPIGSAPQVGNDIKSHGIFEMMAQKLKEMPDLASKIQAIYEWNITKNGNVAAVYTVDLKNGSGSLTQGTIDGLKPGVTLTIDDNDMMDMVTGKLDPQKAFMTGKLKLKGNIMLTQKLKPLLAMRPSGNPTAKPAPAPAPPAPVPAAVDIQSKIVFDTMAERLKEMPDLASKIKAIYEWNITKNGNVAAVYTADLLNGSGKVVQGTLNGVKPGVTLTIDDNDMLAMVTGKLDPQKAFMTGKLKLKGNIMLTQRLKPLLAMRNNNGNPTSAPASSTASANTSAMELKSDKLFTKLAARLKKEPDLASTILTIYQWNILKNGQHLSTWTLDLKNGAGAVYKGTPQSDKPDCTFILEDQLFVDMMSGRADPQKAFMSGKLKITGNVLASQKLQALWENPPDVSDEPEPEPKAQSQSTTASSQSISDAPATLKSDFVFITFAERLHEEPELAQKIKVVYNWNINRDGKKASEWTVDLKTGSGSIYRGSPKSGKADVTLTMEDEDVIQLMLGKLNPQRAFMTGRLKIKGNIMLTQKLNQLWQEILKSGRAVELPILSAILADKPFDPTLRSEPCFVELGKRVSRMPELVNKIQTIFEWNVTKDGKDRTQWILELKKDKGMLYRGPARGDKPTCTLKVDDDLFADWILGKTTASQVLSSEKMKIDGDRSAISKLLDAFKPQAKL